ncbi:MAG TPA: SurA N-terminal domain-containing protein [Pyrinomonadaceae bacterium]|jgi:peptidyl-prolyl cis-trans isomerase D|nr:SurA N-terminal domain-containing protein [Pyrinomonadaceae bacterium]
MLKQLSRLKRTRSVIIVGFVLFLAVSLIAFFGPGRNSSNVGPAKDTAVVAKVAGDEITVAEVSRLKENYLQMFGGRVSMAQLGGYKRFIDGLIRNRVVAQEAARLGLAASDDEARERGFKPYYDASGQFVGKSRYEELVKARYGDFDAYERSVRDEIAQDKLRAFVTAAVNVSEAEVQEDYKRTHTTFDVTYSILSADKLAEKIQVSDEDLKSYYEQHKTDFRILEPQKKIRYVYIDQAKSGEKLPISDKELHDEFDKLPPENKQSGVKVQQILLKVARKDLDNQVEEKAKGLIAKARAASPDTSEKVFADLARGNSEDPATAKSGGYLARAYKKNPNKVDGLYDRTIDMQPGDISDIPIRYGGNWYILRRGESVPKTFDEAKPDLLASLRNRRGYVAAAKLAEKAQARLKETKDPQKVAQELAAEANMKPAEMVKDTPFVKPGDDVPGIGSSQQFEGVIAPLNNANDVGDRTGVKGGFAIPMLVEKKEPRIPDFEEVKTNVATVLKQQRGKEQLEQKAKDLAASLNGASDLKAAAEKAGFEVATDDGFKTGSPLGTAGSSPALDEALYALKSGEVTKTPIKVNDSYVVLGVTTRVDVDLAEFAKQKEQLTQTMLSSKQSQVYEDYITTVQQRMKKDGKIKVYADVLASLEDSEPEVAPQPQPQFPMPGR